MRRGNESGILVLMATLALLASPVPIATLSASPNPAAAFGAVLLWVDPARGSDDNSGETRATALRTLEEAWARVPPGRELSRPYRILLVRGSYPEESLPTYLESRHGSPSAPVSIESVDGRGAAVLGGDLNIFDSRYLSLIDMAIVPDPPGDAVHCERCDHFTIRGATVSGGNREAHETVKINQSTNVFIEESDIAGAGDNAIDFVAVQSGYVVGNRIHGANDWCVYVKGGSADILIEGNEIYDCGTGGFTAGQGTGFQFMVPPYITYEAENIRFVRNEIHDTDGAGMGVNGGRDILLAENRLVRIGRRSHVLEIGFGARSCDGQPGSEARQRCAEYLTMGGWGTTAVDDGTNFVRIPNKDVTVRDNVFANPDGYQSRWQHFSVPGPYAGASQEGSNVPPPALADDGLVIAGNVIVNGGPEMPLGIGGDEGCRDSNPTCNERQLLRDNEINGA
jgi:hypothetical protein